MTGPADKRRGRTLAAAGTDAGGSARRPDARAAMTRLVKDIRATLPFHDPGVCTGRCDGCSLKVLEYLEVELSAWETRLGAGERIGLAELSQLARTARTVHAVLVRNGVVPSTGHDGTGA